LAGVARAATRASVSPAESVPAERTDSAPTAQPAPVSEIVSALAGTGVDLPTDGVPAVPVGSPLEWTGLAVGRRTSAASTAAAPALAATLPLIDGPSGVPIPSQNYIDTVMELYVEPNSPGGTLAPQVLFTPEGLYPITGVKSLPLSTSVDQGLKIVSDTLAKLPAGTTTTLFGYSQSAIIGSLLQAGYVPPNSEYVPPKFTEPTIPEGLRESISFIFVGNEMNPNGGFLSRFPGLSLASLGIEFYGGTPENAYPTTNYTREYDGFADFPRYPLNLLSVLNAGLGIVFVHTKYAPAADCKTFCLTEQEVQNALALPSTSPTPKYFFMPTENLPLLEPLRMLPLIGNPIADLIQPVLKVIVNLGYGDPAHGFTSATQPDANVLVPFGLFPDVSPLEVLSQLTAGVRQGINDFVADFGPQGSLAREISAIALAVQSFSLPPLSFSLPTPDEFINDLQDGITAIADRVSFAIAGLYAALLPTADILNAFLISLPAYSVNLVLAGIEQMINGQPIAGLINAIGLPIAANVGLIATAGLVGVLVWAQAAAAVLIPDLNLTQPEY
jgi:TM2 domain-containing membrane protein YozV